MRKGQLKFFYDTEEVISDQVLLKTLGNHSNVKMKNIVATIQKRQNEIIRNVKSNLLFVEGVAGSGKTTVILQRIAFLLYQYRKKMTAGQVIMFSPNQLFNDYINQVLPELGEQNMIQMTYLQFIKRRIPYLQVELLKSRFDKAQKHGNRSNRNDLINKLKSSNCFFDAVTTYAQKLNKKGLLFKTLKFKGKDFVTEKQLKDIYYSFNDNFNLKNRLEHLQASLINKLNRMLVSELNEDWVEEEVQNLSKEEMNALLNDYSREFGSEEEEFKFFGQQIIKEALQPLYKKIINKGFLKVNAQYFDFLESLSTIIPLANWDIDNNDWEMHLQEYLANLDRQQISFLDSSSYLYLYDLITGKQADYKMQYVFIDEMQDYDSFQLSYLKYIFPKARFTLLGDLNQDILHSDEHDLVVDFEKQFDSDKVSKFQLKTSYRSTKQITDFSKAILGDPDIESFARNGSLPECLKLGEESKIIPRIVSILQDSSDNSTAIICKTLQDCLEVHEQLSKQGINVHLIKSENQRLSTDLIIIPSFLAKGLEFDRVIVWDASADNYGTQDKKLLYTVCSRAMHSLVLITHKELPEVVIKADNNLYKLK